MNRFYLVLFIFALGAINLNPQSLNPKEVLVAGVEYPPYTSALLPKGGLVMELLRESLKDAGYTVRLVVLPSARAQAEFQNGNYAVTTFAIPDYDSNPNIINSKILTVNIVFFYKISRGSLEWNKLTDLKGKSVGIMRTFSSEELFKPMREAGLAVVQTNSLESAFQMLQADRVNLVFSVDLAGYDVIKKELNGNPDIVVAKKPYSAFASGPCFNRAVKGADDLFRAYQTGWARMLRDGSAHRIFEVYYGKGRVPPNAFGPIAN